MRRTLFLLAVLAGALSRTSATAADQAWIRAVTPNFELYTTEGESKAREAILLPEERIRIVGFQSEREYRPFSLRSGAPAFYMSAPRGGAIVMQGLDSTYRPAAVHEFVHLPLSTARAKLPLWLNEGLAQLYETLTPVTQSQSETLPRAEGVLLQGDCLGKGARVWIQSGQRRLAYLIPAGNQIVILRRGEGVEGSVKRLEFQQGRVCGDRRGGGLAHGKERTL